MTLKEAKLVWTFIGKVEGYTKVLNKMSEYLGNDIIKDISTDLMCKLKIIKEELNDNNLNNK